VANPDETPVVVEGQPANTVAHWAREHHADVIVVPRHGGPERTVIGGFSQKLLGIAPCSVLLVHQEGTEHSQ
jgi:nucleotide-binding universal stress UspA family protein